MDKRSATVNIAVAGAKGRVGQLVVKAIKEHPDLVLSASIIHTPEESLQFVRNPIDVLIDFTEPDATMEHLQICSDRSFRMVIGTTGFTEAQKKEIIKASKKIPIVLSPNMSIGINLSFKLLELTARALKKRADVAILDLHRKHKKDAPSGTALRMGEIVAKEQGTTLEKSGIHFSSLRLGEALGDHTALFALPFEHLEITHKTLDRSIFAEGAIMAAQWLMDKPSGLYDMQDVLELTDQ